MNSNRRQAAAMAALIFGVTASFTYLMERLYERLRAGRRDPRLILGEAHAMFYWRAFLAAWWGSVIAVIAYRLLVASDRRNPRWLAILSLALFPIAILWAWRLP